MKLIKALSLAKKSFWVGFTFLGIMTVSTLLFISLLRIRDTYTYELTVIEQQAEAVSLLLKHSSALNTESTRQQVLNFNELLSEMQQAARYNFYQELLQSELEIIDSRLLSIRYGWQLYLRESAQAKADLTHLESILRTNARNYRALLSHLQRREVQAKLYIHYTILLVAGLLSAWGILTALLFLNYVVYPLRKIVQVVQRAASGDLTEKVQYSSSDEMGKLAQSLNQIIDTQLQLSVFAQGIGKGNYQAMLPQHYQEGSLGAVLEDMRDTLRKVAQEEQKRKWTTEGLATFGELFRNHQADLQVLGREFITKLVNYLGANQGALFLLYQDESEGPYLEPLSAYAWERQRFLNNRIAFGEGLVGQSAREADTLYITDVPQDYIHITSGLGNATPRSILVVPLRSNEGVQGVIEIASFKPLDVFEIEFVEEIGQIAASTLTLAKTNAQTRSLLEESQLMNDQLKAQEEFLREMGEKLEYAKLEMDQQIKSLKAEKAKNMALLEGCVDGVICFNGQGTVEFINKATEEIWLVSRQGILQHSIKQLLPLRISGSEIALTGGSTDKTITNRTEVSFRNQQDQDVDVLLTLSRAKVEEEYAFTLFVQKISVDLF